MFPESWQIGFSVKGLRAPDEIMLNDNILIKGTPHDDAYVFLKVTIENETEKNSLRDDMMTVLNNILHMYGLISNQHTQLQSGSAHAQISSENPFGYTKYPPDALRFLPMPTVQQREENTSVLSKTVEKYNIVKNFAKNKRKRFLLNAIEYYNRSLGNYNNEVKLIDLMICLESLFSREKQELRLRYSLRMSQLLGSSQQEKIPEIFRNVYALYSKRSKIVHGSEDVKLNDKDIRIFRYYLKEAIKIYIHIDESKELLLNLLDESVYDLAKRESLGQIVSEAVTKW